MFVRLSRNVQPIVVFVNGPSSRYPRNSEDMACPGARLSPAVHIPRSSSDEDYSGELPTIKSVAAKLGYAIVRYDSPEIGRLSTGAIEKVIQNAAMVIALVVTIDPDFTMQIGYGRGIKKPTIYIASDVNYIASAFRPFKVLIYDLSKLSDLAQMLENAIRQAAESPELFLQVSGNQGIGKPYIFVSYCHQDKEYIDRLLVHLKPLEQDGRVDLWVDTGIHAGDLWKKEIEKALEQSSIAILLVSADFLASDFIRNNELPPILKSAESKGTRILPVVLKPCRFSRDRALENSNQ